MGYYRDDTADIAIANADADIKAEKVVKEVLRYVKGNGYRVVGELRIQHKLTGRYYVRFFNKKKR